MHLDAKYIAAKGLRHPPALVEPPCVSPEVRFTLGDVVRKLREAKGLTIRQFAKEAGVAVGALSNLENDGSNSEQRTIYRVAKALEVTVADLYAFAEPMALSAEQREWIKLLADLPSDRRDLVMQLAQRQRELARTTALHTEQAASPSKTGTRDGS